MKLSKMFITTALIGGIAAPAFAETSAMTTTALNLRAGPSEFAQSQMVLDSEAELTIEGCLEDLSWCKVTHEDHEGWVYGNYLNVGENADTVVALNADGTEAVNVLSIETTNSGDDGTAAAAGATVGALTAFALGGPVGVILASGVAGAVAGDVAAEITEDNIVYVSENPVDTIYLDGEVVVGVAIPDGLTTYEIPNSEYRYLVVNNTPVLIDTETNAVVGIIK